MDQRKRYLTKLDKNKKDPKKTQKKPGSGGLYILVSLFVVVVLAVGAYALTGAIPVQNTVSQPPTVEPYIDGIPCQTKIPTGYQEKLELLIYVKGKQENLPSGIGVIEPIKNSIGAVTLAKCYYWIHIIDDSGAVEVDTTTKTTYYLGELFDIWKEPLTGDEIAGQTGTVTPYLNGKAWTQNVELIPLINGEIIQLDLGEVVPPAS